MALAHDPGLSVATARQSGATLWIELAMAQTDAEHLVGLDADHDGKVTKTEFLAALPALRAVATQAFRVTVAGVTLRPSDPIAELDARNGVQLRIPFQGATTGVLSIRAELLSKLPRGHREFFSMRDENHKLLGEQMLNVNRAEFTAQLINHPSTDTTTDSFRGFLGLGVQHIATGYDHILFLLGLLIVGDTLRSALRIITSFTVAHSITLALATLNIINLSPRIIEPLIACSIVFVGLQNLLCRRSDKRWLITFGFGLIHGCGFATALRDLGIGTNGTGIAVPLLSFNLGVELGQLAIAALVLPLIWKCQTSPVFVRRLVPIGSAAIVLAGSYWLLERTVL